MKKLLIAVAFALPVAASAHHGWSEYDSSKLLKLSGKIVESGYAAGACSRTSRTRG